MTDRELLELAAKAAGIEIITDNNLKYCNYWIVEDGEVTCFWNPLTSDGDALRLAVKLHLHLQIDDTELGEVFAFCEVPSEISELTGSDPYHATRRAIVRAAAEIGKYMTPTSHEMVREGK